MNGGGGAFYGRRQPGIHLSRPAQKKLSPANGSSGTEAWKRRLVCQAFERLRRRNLLS